MALYVDTANPEEARQALGLGIVGGITTNPTLMRRMGESDLVTLDRLLALNPGQLFVQLVGHKADQLEQYMEKVRVRFPKEPLVFKVTPTWDGIRFCQRWQKRERFLITAVNALEQAYVAQEAGAGYVAVYLHRYRLRHGAWPPLREIKQVTGEHLRIMVASCHNIGEVQWALINGADDLTLPLSTIQQLLVNRDSEEDIARFDRDASRSGKSANQGTPTTS
jgi:transaldolase